MFKGTDDASWSFPVVLDELKLVEYSDDTGIPEGLLSLHDLVKGLTIYGNGIGNPCILREELDFDVGREIIIGMADRIKDGPLEAGFGEGDGLNPLRLVTDYLGRDSIEILKASRMSFDISIQTKVKILSLK